MCSGLDSISRLEAMMMKVSLPDGNERMISISPMRVRVLLEDMGIDPLEVIVSKNSRVISGEETVEDGDELQIVRLVQAD